MGRDLLGANTLIAAEVSQKLHKLWSFKLKISKKKGAYFDIEIEPTKLFHNASSKKMFIYTYRKINYKSLLLVEVSIILSNKSPL